jgi:hypothetical protein
VQCVCGCGQTTEKTTKSDPKRGLKVGDYQKYCKGHSDRRPGRPHVPEGHHYCCVCKEIKLVRFFSKSKRKSGGWEDACRKCHQKRTKLYRDKNRLQYNMYRRLINYKSLGFDFSKYVAMFESQKGCCAICDRPFSGLYERDVHIDHCHKTNQIRGLLCGKCNPGLGHFEDNVKLLSNAIFYLKRQSL